MTEKKKNRRAKGEGSVYYRKDRKCWCASVTITTNDNKTKRKTLYAKTKAEALEKKRKLEAEIMKGTA